jgi:signal transduction histidine kinase
MAKAQRSLPGLPPEKSHTRSVSGGHRAGPKLHCRLGKQDHATRATIKMVGVFPNILLRIEDDGEGFDVAARELKLNNEKRMGLRSMKERVNLLQGRMTIQSRPMKGTKILITYPFNNKNSADFQV